MSNQTDAHAKVNQTDAHAKVIIKVNTLGDLDAAVHLLYQQGFKDTDEVNPDTGRDAQSFSLSPDTTLGSLASPRRITADVLPKTRPRLVIWMQRALVVTDTTEDENDPGRNV